MVERGERAGIASGNGAVGCELRGRAEPVVVTERDIIDVERSELIP
jgi:hypothetical protein